MKSFRLTCFALILLLTLMRIDVSNADEDPPEPIRWVIEFAEGLIPVPISAFITWVRGVIQEVADRLDLEFDVVLEIPGLRMVVVVMSETLAKALAKLPFVEIMEQDERIPFLPPIFSRRWNETDAPSSRQGAFNPLTSESTPFGIGHVKALLVDDDLVSNRKVCVVDSGYDLQHVDLPNDPNFVSGSDDNGAGDWFEDGLEHGTHVTGTIAALGGNGRGVKGVIRSGQVELHIVRVFDSAGGFAWAGDLVNAIQQCVDAGANVVNLSLGRTAGGFKDFEDMAYTKFFEEDDVLLVAAAGNHGTNAPNYPSSYDAMVSVSAIDEDYEVAPFSAYHDSVELAGPGVNVLSTIPGNDYAFFQGTSMATPHVAGVAALVWSHFPDRTAKEIREVLQLTAQDLGPQGRDEDFGFGLVRADLAFEFLNNGQEVTPEPTPVPTPPGSPIECEDEPSNWKDEDGDGCEIYDNEFKCKIGRFFPDENGVTAQDACCSCGGGSANVCQDDPPGWFDNGGDGCDWYEQDPQSRCAEYGDCCENFGKTANEACCACQGIASAGEGNRSKEPFTFAPSISPPVDVGNPPTPPTNGSPTNTSSSSHALIHGACLFLVAMSWLVL